jgi:hypothetical protein
MVQSLETFVQSRLQCKHTYRQRRIGRSRANMAQVESTGECWFFKKLNSGLTENYRVVIFNSQRHISKIE